MMPSMSSASSYSCAFRHLTGSVAISVRMIIAAVGCAVMGMASRLRASIHLADRDAAARTVTVSALMCIAAINYAIMNMMPCLFTLLLHTDSGRIAAPITVSVLMFITTVSIFVVNMPSLLLTAFLCADLTQIILFCSIIRPMSLMAMCRNRHHR